MQGLRPGVLEICLRRCLEARNHQQQPWVRLSD